MMCSILELKPGHIYGYLRLINSQRGLFYYEKKPGGRSPLVLNLPLDALLMPIDDEIINDGTLQHSFYSNPVFYRKMLGVNIEFLGWIATFENFTEFLEVTESDG